MIREKGKLRPSGEKQENKLLLVYTGGIVIESDIWSYDVSLDHSFYKHKITKSANGKN